MTRKYYFSRPLSEVIERRKGHYLAQVEKTLDTLYKRANVPTIEKYERNLCELSSEIAGGKLERKIRRKIYSRYCQRGHGRKTRHHRFAR